jgi:hypothetical protein
MKKSNQLGKFHRIDKPMKEKPPLNPELWLLRGNKLTNPKKR